MMGKLIWNFRNISHIMSGRKGSQKQILMVLLKSGWVIRTALTEYFGVQPESASDAVSKMEAVGLIVRQENEDDHRTVNIELTETKRKKLSLPWRNADLGARNCFPDYLGMSRRNCWKKWPSTTKNLVLTNVRSTSGNRTVVSMKGKVGRMRTVVEKRKTYETYSVLYQKTSGNLLVSPFS